MQGQQVSARDNLVTLSQHTNYLGNWSQQLQQQHSKHKKQQQQQEQILRRQESQRYGLKRWQNRRCSLNQLQYPIISKNIQSPEESQALSKSIFSNPIIESKLTIKHRDNFNREINKIIEDGIIKLKLEHFRKNIERLQHNIHQQEQSYKATHLPRSFAVRKHHKGHKFASIQAKEQQERSVHEYKNDFEIQRRKYSMPNLGKIHTRRYVDFDRQ